MKNISLISRQQGVALFVSLVFLVIITVLSLSAINTSVMEQKMASNSQLGMEANQYTQLIQDLVQEIVNEGSSGFKFISGKERTVCINKTTSIKGSCDTTVIQLTNAINTNVDNAVSTAAINSSTFSAEVLQFQQLTNVRKEADEGAGHISIAPYEIIATYIPDNVTFVRGYSVAGDAIIGDGSKLLSGGLDFDDGYR